MKKLKVLSLVLCIIMLVSCLVACGDTKTDDSGNNNVATGVKGLDSSVVATVDGKEIKHSDVGAELIAAEREAIQNYLYTQLVTEFFEDKIEITDERIDTELNLMKATVGEDNWEMYLLFYGGGTEEAFKKQIKDALKQEEYIIKKGKEVGITDEEIKSEFDNTPNKYKVAVMNCFFCDSEEELDKAIELVKQHKSINDIATEMEKTLKEEHTYYESDIVWEKDLNKCSVGDIVYTTKESGSYVVGSITELHSNWNDEKVKEGLETKLYQDKGYEVVNKEFEDFLKAKKIKILGEDFSFVQEEAPLEDVTENVVSDASEEKAE